MSDTPIPAVPVHQVPFLAAEIRIAPFIRHEAHIAPATQQAGAHCNTPVVNTACMPPRMAFEQGHCRVSRIKAGPSSKLLCHSAALDCCSSEHEPLIACRCDHMLSLVAALSGVSIVQNSDDNLTLDIVTSAAAANEGESYSRAALKEQLRPCRALQDAQC